MNYFVLDVETANPDYASICQIGLIEVRNGEVVSTESILVDPDDYFDPFNVGIHGISSDRVIGKPKFPVVHQELATRLQESLVVHHGPFDRVAMQRAASRSGVPFMSVQWLDNQRVVRRAWADFARSGYGLKSLCRHFSIEFTHHDALEDARVTDVIFRRAIAETGLSPLEWVDQSRTRSAGSGSSPRMGAEDGPFFGQTIVFTGEMEVDRRDAAAIASKIGFNVADSMSKKVTTLVVGIQDRDKLAGYDKSSKQRKAEALREDGHEITIISEGDFWALVPKSLLPDMSTAKVPPKSPGNTPRASVIDLSLDALFTDEELEEMFFGVSLDVD